MHTSIRGAVLAATTALATLASATPVPGQGTWETTLLPRDLDGNAATIEAYYDTVLDITWTADWDLFPDLATSSEAWAMRSGVSLFGLDGWRIPVVDRSLLADPLGFMSNDGTTIIGTAYTGVGWGLANEIGHMHYVTLGNGTTGMSNTGPFSVTPRRIWWLTADGSHPSVNHSYFDLTTGASTFDVDLSDMQTLRRASVILVHDGDVRPVPEPATLLLLALGLAGLTAVPRRRRGPRQPRT